MLRQVIHEVRSILAGGFVIRLLLLTSTCFPRFAAAVHKTLYIRSIGRSVGQSVDLGVFFVQTGVIVMTGTAYDRPGEQRRRRPTCGRRASERRRSEPLVAAAAPSAMAAAAAGRLSDDAGFFFFFVSTAAGSRQLGTGKVYPGSLLYHNCWLVAEINTSAWSDPNRLSVRT